MEQLTIVGTEDGRLVLTNAGGDRFALAIDSVLRSELRQADRAASATPGLGAQVSPRDIQAQIRAGVPAADVAKMFEIDIASVERFEGPVLAERDYIVGRALAVPVLMGVDLDGDPSPTFGSAIRTKLDALESSVERWTSWKEDASWIVKLTFTASGVDHDARWTFEPKRSALAPQNSVATQLSRQGPMPEGLIPRLRALQVDSVPAEDANFDEAVFDVRSGNAEDAARDGLVPATDAAHSAGSPDPGASQPTRSAHTDTADLLEALRRKRGHRSAPPRADESADRAESPETPTPEPLSLFKPGVLDDEPTPTSEPIRPGASTAPSESDRPRRRGRATMPSWDEIVFGPRDDDPR